jgi:HEAT repeat protein
MSSRSGRLPARLTAALVLFASACIAAEKPADPAQLASQLSSSDVVVRREASYQLAMLGAKAAPALPALIKALNDADKQVWMNAIAAVAAIGPEAKDAIPTLLADFDSKSASRQRSYYRDQVIIRTSYALTRIGPAAIPPLIDGLRSHDTMMRSGAARALGGMGPAAKAAIPALLENLGHKDASVQQDVIDALGSIGAAAKPKLIEALSSDDPRQRSTAALALGAMGRAAQDASGPVLAQLDSESDATARASLLTALARIGADVAPVLIEALKDEREPIRHAAINGLLTMRSAQPQIVKALTALVRDPDAAVSERAAYALGRLGEVAAPAVPAILDVIEKRAPAPQAFLDAIVQIGEPAIAPLLERFEKTEPAIVTRDHWAVKCVQQMGGLGAGRVARSLTHPSPSVRLLAARALVELGPDAESATPALLKALADKSMHVRAAALTALVAARTPLAQLEPHLHAAFKSSSPVIRAAAVESAVRLDADGKAFRPLVIAALKDPDETVRKSVINQLGPDFADAVPQLIPLLDDPARRAPACEALGRMGTLSKAAVPRLIRLVSEENKDDRLRALQALSQIGAAAAEAAPALQTARADSDPAIRIAAFQAVSAVQKTKQNRIAALVAGLDDTDVAVRKAMADMLGALGDQAVDAFGKLVELTDRDSDREFALATLSNLRVRDVPKLVGLLQHPQRSVQFYACYRLNDLGRRGKDALPMLESLAKSDDRELANAARRAIRSITLR